MLWELLTAERWKLIKLLCGTGPLPVRDISLRSHRSMDAIDADVRLLSNVGMLLLGSDGQVQFPFDAVKVEFLLQAA